MLAAAPSLFKEEHPMSLTSRVAGPALLLSPVPALILVLILVSGAAPAMAADCPAKSTQMDDIIDAINAAPGCDRAMTIFEACEFGTSGDVQFGAVVEKKCEGDFLGRLTPPKKQAYQHEMRVCDRKYRNESGTMYLSFTAFCRAEVAQRYSQRARKTSGASR
jgi:hypothetical protein